MDQVKKLEARRSEITTQLARMSRNSWRDAMYEDCSPLERELRAIDTQRAAYRQARQLKRGTP